MDTSEVEICTRWGMSSSHCMLISRLSHQLADLKEAALSEVTNLPNEQPQFESVWPGPFFGNQNSVFSQTVTFS